MKRHVSAYLDIIMFSNSTTIYTICVWRILKSHLDKNNLYEIETACEQVRCWACVGVWYCGRVSSAVGSVAVGVGGGSGWRIRRYESVKIVALQIRRLDAFLLVLVFL